MELGIICTAYTDDLDNPNSIKEELDKYNCSALIFDDIINNRLPWTFTEVTRFNFIIAVKQRSEKERFATVFTVDVNPPASPHDGLWSSRDEIMALPDSGPAWDNIVEEAQEDVSDPDLENLTMGEDVATFAKALVYVRTGDTSYRDEVRDSIKEVIDWLDLDDLDCDDSHPHDPLPIMRNVAAYVLAADVIQLSDFPVEDAAWRAWIEKIRCITFTGNGPSNSIISGHENRPNNWGTMAGTSRVAIARYLGDDVDLERAADVFRGFLGDRNAYADFDYNELTWQCDEDNPVGINPLGCSKEDEDGIPRNLDGVIPDDQRRCSGCDDQYIVWPPPKENYVWESMQGVAAQAWLLYRAGYDVWQAEDQAIQRAVIWLHTAHFGPDGDEPYPPEGNDRNTTWMVNCAYGTAFDTESPTTKARNVGYADWTHAPGSPLCK